ncbi:MAG: enoyl-CoA hydratase/isomerase family protein [Caulobacterales bacterium]
MSEIPASELPVIARIEGRAGRLTLNRPKVLHSLNPEMCRIMAEALVDWRDDPKVEFVLVDHAPGTRGFCAGGDIKLLADSGATDGKEAADFFRIEYQLNTLIHNYPKPYVAMIDGVTMGGGVGIAVHGSHRIATENTTFAMPESGIGLFPDVGGGWFMPRLKNEIGEWLAQTGARLKGKDVLAAGIATHFIEAAKLEDLKSVSVRDGIRAFDKLETAAEASFAPHLPVMKACFEQPTVEAIFAALDNAKDPWAAKQLADLKTKSPTTLKVAKRQMREGLKARSFEDNMRMEYRIAARIVRTHDFLEGVRAVIVDKDNAPKWNPATPEGVSEEMLDALFADLGDQELNFI